MTTAVRAGLGAMGRRAAWWWPRLAVTAGTLAVLVWQLGTGPFLNGVRAVDGGALAAAAGLPGAALLVATGVRRARSGPWLERPPAGGLVVLGRADGAGGTHS